MDAVICVRPAVIFPVPGASDNHPGRTTVHLNAVRCERSLSAAYFAAMYFGICSYRLFDMAMSSSFCDEPGELK